jgi:hypothetical protein
MHILLTMLSYRHRRSHFSLAEPSPFGRALRPAVGVVLALLVLYVAGTWLLQKVGLGNHTRQTAVVLAVERRGGVQVSLDGKEFTAAQNEMKLYSADRVRTGPNANAALRLFDGSLVRLADQTEIQVVQSDLKTEKSLLTLGLNAGKVWVSIPPVAAFTGSILRTIEAGDFTFDIPPETDAVVGVRSAAVYSAAGLGIKITVPGAVIPVIVGEGQQFALPENYDPEGDLYQYRSPLGALTSVPAFIEESRALYGNRRLRLRPSTVSGSVVEAATALTVSTPANHSTVRSGTVEVRGSVGAGVAAVRVNGYQASLREDRTFSLEVSLPDEDKVTVTVEALDGQGNVLETAIRELTRDRKPPPPPTITSPAREGQTYRTQRTELEIRGTAPPGVAGIIVNDYRLQLFKPGDLTWTYLASLRLQNFQEGENVFTVVAISEAGLKSDPVTLTVLLGGEGEGVIDVGSASSAEITSEEALPQNAPLLPGAVEVTGPVAGTQYTATGAFLLEGAVPKETASVWVNGYRLRLYTAGKTFWNYLADPKLGTLKRGVNTYRINARNEKGEILDTTTYTVTY